ncbi:serine hydrolase domain-containing protein [Embleya hyalina]|nr:serine hydrolase domain-containing protein [Embleya hyalina]
MSDYSGSKTRPSRRSVMGLVGAASLAGGGVSAGGGSAAGAVAGSGAAGAGRVPDELRPGGEYDRLVADLAARDRFAGTVLLAHRGRPVLIRSHGMADRERGIPNGRDTVFNIASVGKFFAGLAVTQLFARRLIRLDGTIGTWLDGFPPGVADTVTVHQLLTHTSGLGDHRADPEWREAVRGWRTPAEFEAGTLDFIRRQRPLFPPGTRSAYSNSGFRVLGAIVARISGGTYADYVHEHILGPAGMTRTEFAPLSRWQTDPTYAHAYGDPQADGRRPDLTAAMRGAEIGGGDGGVFSTAPDLLRFAVALREGRLVGEAHTEMMVSGKYPFGPGMASYGSLISIVNGRRRIGHGGGDPGITANVHSYPDVDWVALFVANQSLVDLRPLIELPDRLILDGGH